MAEGHAHAQVAQRRLEGLGPEHDVVAVNRLDDITLICAPLRAQVGGHMHGANCNLQVIS